VSDVVLFWNWLMTLNRPGTAGVQRKKVEASSFRRPTVWL